MEKEKKSSDGMNKEVYLEAYRTHNKAVIDYFKNRPEQLLVLRLEDKNKGKILAEFLNKEPIESYPHENRRITQYIN